MTELHVLDGYTFIWNPKKITIPESKKRVAEMKTYTGSELFQWPAIDKGQTIDLSWPIMSISMYESLRTLYLSPDVVTWDPKYLGTYGVIVTDLTGAYIDVGLNEQPYREDVVMKLNIRSFAAS